MRAGKFVVAETIRVKTAPLDDGTGAERRFGVACHSTCADAYQTLAWEYYVAMTGYRPSVQSTIARALRAESAEECARLLEDVSDRFVAFRGAMPSALRGEWPSIVVVVNRWQGLMDEVLQSASAELPDLVVKLDGYFGMLTASHVMSAEPVRHLNHLIAEVPFSPLITQFGQDVGVGVVMIDALRTMLPGCPQLRISASSGWPDLPDGADPDRFRSLVDIAIRSSEPPLVRVRSLTMLDMVKRDRDDELRELTERAFDWASTV